MSHTGHIRFNENSYYKKFLDRIEKGEKLDWSKITKRDLYFLNLVERVTDEEIGKLFGVSKDACRNKRKKNNISSTWNDELDELGQDIERYIWETLKYSNRKSIDINLCYRVLNAIHPDYDEIAK